MLQPRDDVRERAIERGAVGRGEPLDQRVGQRSVIALHHPHHALAVGREGDEHRPAIARVGAALDVPAFLEAVRRDIP